MADRNFESARNYGKGLVYADLSFLTNGTGAISLATLRGAGVDAIASIAHPAAGRYTITLKDKFRYVVSKYTELEDLATGTDDGSFATSGPVSNEGSSTLAPSFDVYTRVVAGTKTDFGAGGTGAARRVHIVLCLKNSVVGT